MNSIINNYDNLKLVESKFIFINSINRSNGDNSRFNVYVPSNLLGDTYQKTKFLKISMYDITINYEWYNVNDDNNKFILFDGSTETIFTIPNGSYSVYQLRDYLNVTINSKYTVTYNILNNKFTFTTGDPTAYIKPTTFGQFLGLTNDVIYTGSFESSFVVNM